MHKADIHDLDPTRAPSVFDIDVLRVARVYAQALLKAAHAVGKADDFQEAFDSLVGNPLRKSDAQSDPAALMGSGVIPRHRRDDIIKKLFDGKVDELFVNFLLVLSDHDRLGMLRPIAAMYRQQRDELYRRVRVQVRSAVPLDDGQRKQIAELARTHFQLEPILIEVLNPDLLGGLQVQIGDRLVDMSVRYQLQTIKQQLIERSSHEIQRRRDRVGSDV